VAASAKFDAKRYLGLFDEVCAEKFGRAYDFTRIEKRFEHVRTGKRWLVTKDVLEIFNPKNTPLARYWPVPSEKELDAGLKGRLLLAPLPADHREVVRKLPAVFHNIGSVSVVLRFVHPLRFGIFSSPVVNLLQVHRPTAIDVYLAFCDELLEWQRHFGMYSAAQMEMALWTYDQIVRSGTNSKEVEKARREFEGDIWIQRRRAAQVIRPFVRNYGPLELARILLEEDANLAGKIAAEEYERLLRCASQKYYRQPLRRNKGAVEDLLGRLVRDSHVSISDGPELRRIWEIRNKAVHPDARPSTEEVEVMIDRIESICTKWESAQSRKP
jgi:hypothetical protein